MTYLKALQPSKIH